MDTANQPRVRKTSGEKAGWAAIIIAVLTFASVVVKEGPSWFRKSPPVESPPPAAAIPQAATAASSPLREAFAESGCRALDNLQLCWGKAALGIDGGNVRSFDLTFPKGFATFPVITTSIDIQSSGYAYAIYNSILDPSRYRGNIVEVQFRSNQAPVALSYIAIGAPKQCEV